MCFKYKSISPWILNPNKCVCLEIACFYMERKYIAKLNRNFYDVYIQVFCNISLELIYSIVWDNLLASQAWYSRGTSLEIIFP